MGKSGSNGNHIIIDKKKGSIMNDSEKIEAIKKTLSHNIDYKKLMRQYAVSYTHLRAHET